MSEVTQFRFPANPGRERGVGLRMEGLSAVGGLCITPRGAIAASEQRWNNLHRCGPF